MFSEPVGYAIMIGAGGALVYHACLQIKRGVAHTTFATYPRQTRAAAFWAWVLGPLLIGSANVLIGIAGLSGA